MLDVLSWLRKAGPDPLKRHGWHLCQFNYLAGSVAISSKGQVQAAHIHIWRSRNEKKLFDKPTIESREVASSYHDWCSKLSSERCATRCYTFSLSCTGTARLSKRNGRGKLVHSQRSQLRYAKLDIASPITPQPRIISVSQSYLSLSLLDSILLFPLLCW